MAAEKFWATIIKRPQEPIGHPGFWKDIRTGQWGKGSVKWGFGVACVIQDLEKRCGYLPEELNLKRVTRGSRSIWILQ